MKRKQQVQGVYEKFIEKTQYRKCSTHLHFPCEFRKDYRNSVLAVYLSFNMCNPSAPWKQCYHFSDIRARSTY